MAEVTTVTGIILSAMPVGEYDRRLVILTKELGKISVFAKGARKQNSALIGVTRPFILGTFEVYRGRDSYTMYKASAQYYFEEVAKFFNSTVDRQKSQIAKDTATYEHLDQVIKEWKTPNLNMTVKTIYEESDEFTSIKKILEYYNGEKAIQYLTERGISIAQTV